jgi:hypothetical protein
MMKWLPKVSAKTVYAHIAAWLVYVPIMYRYNLKAYPDPSIGRIIALVILLAFTFYLILALLFWLFQRTRKRLLLMPLLGAVGLFVLFAWGYIYVLAPAFGWKIYREDIPYSHKQFVANAGRVLKEMGKYAAIYFLFYHNVLKKRRLTALMLRLRNLRRGLHRYRLKGEVSRLSPHFLMNAFNHCYSLVCDLSEALGRRIFYLAEILKYGMSEQNSRVLQTVTLEREVSETAKLLKAYYGDDSRNAPIRLLCAGNYRAFRLPAFTLINCVENLLKYAVLDHSRQQAVLRVVTAGDTLLVTAVNAVKQVESKTVSSGSGLIDLRNRLRYLLGVHFTLSYWREGDLFILFLVIERH